MKDYSNSSRLGALPIHIGYFFNMIFCLTIMYILNIKNGFIIFLILGFTESFITLDLTGKYLDKHCTNKDNQKCEKCHNWNCTRERNKND